MSKREPNAEQSGEIVEERVEWRRAMSSRCGENVGWREEIHGRQVERMLSSLAAYEDFSSFGALKPTKSPMYSDCCLSKSSAIKSATSSSFVV